MTINSTGHLYNGSNITRGNFSETPSLQGAVLFSNGIFSKITVGSIFNLARDKTLLNWRNIIWLNYIAIVKKKESYGIIV